MVPITSLTKAELEKLKSDLDAEYGKILEKGISMDMSRGKPSPDQLDLSNPMLDMTLDLKTKEGIDPRNYGVLDGLLECKELFSELLDIPKDQIIIGGNASLNLMYDALSRLLLFGTDGKTPWVLNDKPIKFLCPAPGYDRHFSMCQRMGIEMIPVAMKEDGPDMDQVEKLAAEDKDIKGIWCVPFYSNPGGVCYSSQVIKRLCEMKTAAEDFKIFWDNAYGVHGIYNDAPGDNIFKVAKEAGTEDRVYYFFSTSKITFPGSGVSVFAASKKNVDEVKVQMSAQTIGHDKLNQLRHVQFFKNAGGIHQHMKLMANILRPKFEIVLKSLEESLGGSGLATWSNPRGGYFVSVDTMPGTAKEIVALAKKAGLVLTNAGATFPYGLDPQDQNIRIAPSYPTEKELAEAMEVFCLCVKIACTNKLLEA